MESSHVGPDFQGIGYWVTGMWAHMSKHKILPRRFRPSLTLILSQEIVGYSESVVISPEQSIGQKKHLQVTISETAHQLHNHLNEIWASFCVSSFHVPIE